MFDFKEKLLNNQWYLSLPNEFKQFINHQNQLIHLNKGQVLFHRGNHDDGMYALLHGELNLGFSDIEGHEFLILIGTPVFWFGEISLIDGKPRTHDAIAATNITLLHLKKEHLLNFFNTYPQCWYNIAQLLSQKIRPLLSEIESNRTEPLQQRLARRLLLIVKNDDIQQQSHQPRIEISQEKLGLLLSASRQSVNSALQTLEQQKIIKREFRNIVILDINALNQIAGEFI